MVVNLSGAVNDGQKNSRHQTVKLSTQSLRSLEETKEKIREIFRDEKKIRASVKDLKKGDR
jgi:hypothetical protein